MAQIRNSGPQGLQQLIDSYNEEIMRYSRLASPETEAAETLRQNSEKELAERQREEGEFEAERGVTEQNYWLGKGKYGVIRHDAETDGTLRTAAVNSEKAGKSIESMYDSAEAEYAGESSGSENQPQKQWLADLEQGLLELKRGLEELAEGQRELREGQLAYLKGVAERDYWLGQKNDVPHGSVPGPQYDESGYDPYDGENYGEGGFVPSGGAADYPGESFRSPAGAVPVNPPDTPPAQSPDSVPSDGTGFGAFQASVYTARRSVPVPGALVTVFSGGSPYASYITDGDGKTPVIQLPAGTASALDESYAAPFVNYRVIVTADGYYPQNDLTAQIFSGETAFLPVEMVPLPDGV